MDFVVLPVILLTSFVTVIYLQTSPTSLRTCYGFCTGTAPFQHPLSLDFPFRVYQHGKRCHVTTLFSLVPAKTPSDFVEKGLGSGRSRFTLFVICYEISNPTPVGIGLRTRIEVVPVVELGVEIKNA